MKRNLEILGSAAYSVLAVRQSGMKMSTMRAAPCLRVVLASGMLGLMLAGCGQKGPLYLPAPAASSPATTPASKPTTGPTAQPPLTTPSSK